MLPVSVRDELDRRASREGMRRSTLIRVIVIRDVRRNGDGTLER